MLALSGLSGTAFAARWQVEITNVTPGQTFTPFLVAAHYGNKDLFEVGQPPTPELAMLAEGGDTGPLSAMIEDRWNEVQTVPGLLGPGQSVTVDVNGRPGQRLSIAAMLVPTNDTFIGVDGVFLPLYGETVIEALAYDAGSEPNDQNCAHMPGPGCGGAGYSPEPTAGDEGFVHVSNGFHDLGSTDDAGNTILSPVHYSWNNPVAVVRIRRVH
jgi:hypothetical protein